MADASAIRLDGADLRHLSPDDRQVAIAIAVGWGVVDAGRGRRRPRLRGRAGPSLKAQITELTLLRELSEGSEVTHHLQQNQRSEEAGGARAWLLWVRRSRGGETKLGMTSSMTVRKSQALQRRLPDLRRALSEEVARGPSPSAVVVASRLYLLGEENAEQVLDLLGRLLRGTGLDFVAEIVEGLWIGPDCDGALVET